MKYFIEDFVEATNLASSRDEMFVLYNEALGKFGFDRNIYTFLTDFPSINHKAGHGIKSNYPDDWMQHYQKKNYQSIDPVIIQVLKGTGVFTWTQLIESRSVSDKQICILEESREAGLCDGVGVPLYGSNGTLAGVGIASSLGGINPDKTMLNKIKIISEQFHLVYCETGHQTVQKNFKPLTARETEVIKWWAQGKTGEEIALILNCAVDTVKFHSRNIFVKLQANNRIFAVTKAIRLGIIPLHTIAL